MKKVLLFLPLTALLLSSTCKKSSFSCDCSISGGTNGGYTVASEDLGEISKTDAQNQCSSWINEQQANVQAAGGTGTVGCMLNDH